MQDLQQHSIIVLERQINDVNTRLEVARRRRKNLVHGNNVARGSGGHSRPSEGEGPRPSSSHQASSHSLSRLLKSDSSWFSRHHEHGSLHGEGYPEGLSRFEYHLTIGLTETVRKARKDFSIYDSWPTCLLQAVNSEKRRKAELAGADQTDVCWWVGNDVQYLPINYSAALRTPQCSLSATLGMIAYRIHSLFLTVQYDVLSSIQETSQHPIEEVQPLTEEVQISTSASPPDPASYSHCGVRCYDVHTVRPMGEIVEKAIDPIINSFQALLPRDVWRRACIDCMRSLEARVPKQEVQPPTSEGAQAQGGMQWADLQAANIYLLLLIIQSIHRCLLSPPAESFQPQSLQAVRDNMSKLLVAKSLTGVISESSQIGIIHKVIWLDHMDRLPDTVQVRRAHARAYHKLRLTRSAKLSLAARWKAWCRRRSSLSSHLTAASAALSAALLPSHSLHELAQSLLSKLHTDFASDAPPSASCPSPSDEPHPRHTQPDAAPESPQPEPGSPSDLGFSALFISPRCIWPESVRQKLITDPASIYISHSRSDPHSEPAEVDLPWTAEVMRVPRLLFDRNECSADTGEPSPGLLGQSAKLTQSVLQAVAQLLDVHSSIGRTNWELFGPFEDLTPDQEMLMEIATHVTDSIAMFRQAAMDIQLEALFRSAELYSL